MRAPATSSSSTAPVSTISKACARSKRSSIPCGSLGTWCIREDSACPASLPTCRRSSPAATDASSRNKKGLSSRSEKRSLHWSVEQADVAANSPAPWSILVVDDDAGLRDVAAQLLTTAGHLVHQAADGPEALAMLERSEFDIVLLDINLPSMNGLDVLALIRAMPHPPLVVMMTGDDAPQPLLEAERLQAFRYLRKPFPLRTITEVVREAMASALVARLPIQVVSAKPEWMEVVAPCTLEMVDRIQSFMMHLEAD